jgi:uncharacterized protein (TIGR03435 family)
MLQNLLMERFRLRIRNEKRNLPAFALVRSRQDGMLGPKLMAVEVDCEKVRAELAGQAPPSQASGPARRRCMMLANNSMIRVYEQPLTPFVEQLSRFLHAPILDRTALEGSFNIDLQWAPPREPGADPSIDDRGSLFTALGEQLGLKLESIRAPVDVIVVISVQRPTAN